ncbi:MAG: restriction endonuclease subunit S [Balneola sp.]
MREDWVGKKLDEVTEVINGGTPKTSVSEYWDGDNAWITPKDLGQLTSEYVDKTSRTLTDLGLSKSSAKLIPINSVILSTRAPIGHLAINQIPMGTNQGCRGIVPKSNLETRYLYYFLNKSIGLLNDLGTGTTFKELSAKALKSVEIPIPPLPEQKRIVEILDEAFEAIDQAKANIEKNIQNAEELFQSKLNEIFSQKGEGWEEYLIGDVCELSQGLAINKKTKHLLVEKSSLPLYRIKDLKSGTVSQYVSEEGYPEKTRVLEDDLIYTRTGSLGLVFRGMNGVLHNNSFKVDPKELITKDFMYWWLQNPNFREKILSLASKMAQPDITHRLFKKQKILIPPLGKQNEIYNLIEDLNNEHVQLLRILKQKSPLLEELKKSILQKAFSGELTGGESGFAGFEDEQDVLGSKAAEPGVEYEG